MREIVELTLLEAVLNEDNVAAEIALLRMSDRDRGAMVQVCNEIIDLCINYEEPGDNE